MVRNFIALCAVFAPIALFACGNSSSTTTSTGTGGSGSSSTAGTGGAAASSTTATTGTTTASGSGTGGAMPSGACTNTADQTLINAPNSQVTKEVSSCGTSNIGMEPATLNCIETMTGLSTPCSTCYDATVSCTVNHCIGQCLSDSSSPACQACQEMYCLPAFFTCSGLTPPPADAGTGG